MVKIRTQKKKAPTNTDLMRLIQQWREDDRREYKKRHDAQDDKILGLASKDDVAAVQTDIATISKALFDEDSTLKLATRADVQPVVDLYQKLMLSAKITGGFSKWMSRTILVLAATLIGWSALMGYLQSFIATVITWGKPGA